MLNVSEATIEDVNILADIEKTVFEYDLISIKQMRYLIKSSTAMVVKAQLPDDTTVGYMVLLRRSNSSILRLYSIGVLQEYRNSGAGRHLLQSAEQLCDNTGCDALHLEVQMQNKEALVFYLAAGFSLYGRKNGYYTDGSTALLLRKQVHSEVRA